MFRCKLFITEGFISLLIICLYCLQSLPSADTVDYNLKFYGYSSHFEKDWFFHPGLQVDRDLYLTNWLIARSSIAVYRDSGHLVAGFFHLGLRVNVRKFNRFYIRFGFGPTLVWRQNWWLHKDEYQGTSFYGDQYHSDRFEKNFLLYGGDVEIEWVIKPNISVLFATIPGYPVIFANSLGIRF
tara:strand:- start:404 stop:952 length:549 start_codon:yes stop_codon:yes gene_type:complete